MAFWASLTILFFPCRSLQLRLEPRTPSTTTHAMSCFASQPCRQGIHRTLGRWQSFREGVKASKFVKDVYAVLCGNRGGHNDGQFAKVTEDLRKPTTSRVLSWQVLLDLSRAASLPCPSIAWVLLQEYDRALIQAHCFEDGWDPRVFSKMILLKAGRAGIKAYKIYSQSSIVFCFVRQSPRDV